MGQNILAGIVGFIISLASLLHIPGMTINRNASVTPTPTLVFHEIPSVTPVPLVTATPSSTLVPTRKILPTIAVTPTIVPTPTVDQKAVDLCNGMYMPVQEFAGHSCLFEDDNYRWMDSVNGHPATESMMDDSFRQFKEGEIKPMILKMCLKTTKEHFEKCSNSIRDNASRIRDELTNKIQSDIQNCLNTASHGGGTQRNFTPRYMAKDRLKGKISELYDFCYSHNDSVAEFHP